MKKKKSLKEKVVALLEKNRETFLSGNSMAESLGVSRTSIWKAVKSLENDGYIIDAVTNKGYRLRSFTDVLSDAGINKYLEENGGKWKISVYDEVASTNDIIREKAAQGAGEGEVAVAVKQTAGKGRLGRSFYSPKGSGLYFSLLLKPEFPLDKVTLITTAAAVAVSRAVDKISGETTEIKWVNDVLLRQRKICGISTEAVFSAELGKLDYIVLGIGVNIYRPKGGFPKEIEGKAGYIFKRAQDDVRNRLTAEILTQFERIYDKIEDGSFVEEYRKRCGILGKEILVCRKDERIPALALDVDEACRLKVRYEGGKEELLNSGEISIKFDNYV